MPPLRGVAVTIGTFDGVHKGHAALIKRLKSFGLETVVVVLEKPFKPVDGLLTSTTEKLNILSSMGVDKIFIIPPDSEIFNMTATAFLKDFLIKNLCASHIVIGHDFAFGKNKTGTYKWLAAQAETLNLQIDLVKAVKANKETVSSSGIRSALKASNLKKASALLGRNYGFCGTAQKGRGVGAKIGFPTINIKPESNKILPTGVFAATVKIKDVLYPAALSIGRRLTFNVGQAIVPEAHILGTKLVVKKDTKIEVELLKKIRSEKKFPSVKALVSAIQKDVARASKFFNL